MFQVGQVAMDKQKRIRLKLLTPRFAGPLVTDSPFFEQYPDRTTNATNLGIEYKEKIEELSIVWVGVNRACFPAYAIIQKS